jgi:predicted RNA-binding protein
MNTDIRFDSLRGDWYSGNQLVPRLIRKVIKGEERKRFVGFPRQWIPIFIYFGVEWQDSCDPPTYIPLISGMTNQELVAHCENAQRTGTLRDLVESIVTLDPVLADFLYIVDNTSDFKATSTRRDSTVKVTSWQSYGRPEIKELVASAQLIRSHKPIAVVLPCARRRPYDTSRTHNRRWQELEYLHLERRLVHEIVITSIGVIPKELWNHPVVLRYDAGVPDIYRILRLSRAHFSHNHYERVIDCLDFVPYSDILSILVKEKLIAHLERAKVRRRRHFYLKGVSNC